MPGIIADLYQIEREIGSGGGGVVYLGRHLRLDKPVAIKADKRKLSEKVIASLRREVETLKNLSHTYIPQVYDFIVDGDTVYTVMDYIDGESLDRPLKRGERFSHAQIVAWAKQALDALVYLHNRPPHGILHSDIKPANIMLTRQGDIRLIDYNIALALGEDGAVSVGRSAGYASPEHYGLDYSSPDTSIKKDYSISPKITTGAVDETIPMLTEETVLLSDGISSKPSVTPASTSGGKKTIVLDVRSDIYSLGATLYHLAGGRRPSHEADKVQPLTDKDCPPGLAAIINKSMSPDKTRRYQSAEDMLADFVNIHRNDPRAKRYRAVRNIAGGVLAAMLAASLLTVFVGLRQMQAAQEVIAINESERADAEKGRADVEKERAEAEKLRADEEALLKAIETAKNNAKQSEKALSGGDKQGAIKFALVALPDTNSFYKVSAVPDVIAALTNALGVYDLSDGFKPHKSVNLPSSPFMADFSPNGKTSVVVYAYSVAVIDNDNASVLYRLPTTQSALAESRFINDTTIAFAGDNGLCVFDISSGKELWRGNQATAIAVSADGKSAAAIYRDEGFATIYDVNGEIIYTVNFEGRKQRVTDNDTFANPRDNIFALSASGQFLAVSFDDGSLSVFDVRNVDNRIGIMPETDYTHFEGGFKGELLAFSATSKQSSVFAVVDVVSAEQLGGFESDNRFGVVANERGIYVSSDNLIVEIDPLSGEQRELVWADADITAFSVGEGYTFAALKGKDCVFFDGEARLVSRHKREYASDMLLIGGEYALLGGRDVADMTIFKAERHDDAEVFTYDFEYDHDEARINVDGDRVILFSVDGFRLYDIDGTLLKEQTLPRTGSIYDQQFSKASGNLAIMWNDALTIYSGHDGAALLELTNLKSVAYSPYGVSVFDYSGQLQLIDLDSGAVITSTSASGNFAAYCGITVDDAFLNGRKFIGSGNFGGGYHFAVSDGAICTVYDETGKKLFDLPVTGDAEAFFMNNAVIVSPKHGTPAAYGLGDGKLIADLERDAYLTYVTSIDNKYVCQYTAIDGSVLGVLTDETFQPVALLPNVCDVWGGRLIFDFPAGVMRQSRVYSIDELTELAKNEPAAQN